MPSGQHAVATRPWSDCAGSNETTPRRTCGLIWHCKLSEDFAIEQLELTAELELPPRFRERGLRRMRERIYRLERG